MTGAVWWERSSTDGAARTGTLHTPHGDVPTPAFMPVGTRGAVRTLDTADLEALGADIVLANTYHLALRPGADAVAALGGLHRMTGWTGPMLTDSGGFQVFSLDPIVTEEGVRFRSTYDGSTFDLTPESSVAVQEQLGADIAMALDVLVGLPAPRHLVEEASEQTLRWAERSARARSPRRPGLVRDRPGRDRARPEGTIGGGGPRRSGSTGTPSAGWRSGRLPRSATLPWRPSSASSPTTPPAT